MIRRIIRNKTILAVLSVAAGIFLIIARRSALDLIVRILGYGLIAAAAGYVLSYFFGPDKDQTKLGYALISGIGGLLVVILAEAIVNVFPTVIGLGLLINAIGNLSQSFADPESGIGGKLLPCLVAVAGLLIMIHPGVLVNSVVIVAGVTLIINGLSDLNMIRRFW